MFKVIASLLAGYGLLLAGLKEFTRLLNQSTSQSFSVLVKKLTKTPFYCVLAGIGVGIFTVGNIVLSVCLAGAAHSMKLINQHKLLLIMNFSRIGSCLYVFLAGFDLTLAILLALGISGISWGLKKPKNWQVLMPLIFQLGIVLYGIQLIKANADLLDNNPVVYEHIALTNQYPLLAVLAGFALMLLSQSFFATMVICISFVGSDVFTLKEATLCIAGIYLGLAVSRYFYIFAFEKSLKKAMSLMPYYYFLCAFLTFLSYSVNYIFLPIPFFQEYAHSKSMISLLNFIMHLATSLSLIPFHKYFIKKPHNSSRELPEEVKTSLIQHSGFSINYLTERMEQEFQGILGIMKAFRSPEEKEEKHPSFRRIYLKNRKQLEAFKEQIVIQKNESAQEGFQQQLVIFLEKLSLLLRLNKALHRYCHLCYEVTPLLKNRFPHLTLLQLGIAMESVMECAYKALKKPTQHNIYILKKVTESRNSYFSDLEKRLYPKVDKEGFFQLVEVLQQFKFLIYLLSQLQNCFSEMKKISKH